MAIEPKPIDITFGNGFVEIRLPNNSTKRFPIFSEANREGKFDFCYAELTRDAIYNDDECQPRAIKPLHLWQIYNDINRNPLHEAPTCRLIKIDGALNTYKSVMFDGQHKTLSFWIADRETIVVKIYLNITKESSIRLVNSIQSKIKKLPLSPFELAAKMADEWQDRVSRYEEEVGTDKASEDGFLKWVDKDERNRAKAAFEDALYQNILDNENLEFKKLILQAGPKKPGFSISESTFRNKVLKQLIHTSPLKESFSEGQVLRDRESTIIIRILNSLYKKVFEPNDGQLSEQDKIRAERFVYQSSLAYTSALLRDVIGKKLLATTGREFIDKDFSPEFWSEIELCIDRILKHPLWTASYETSVKMKAIRDALSKNQDAARAFSEVGLKPGYVGGLDILSASCLG